MAEPVRVLHVDDEPDFADMAATYLEREDEQLSVQTATSVREGLELLAEHEFDCVVSDYDMPQQNGLAFLQAVREEDDDLPFILFTGKGSEEIASEAVSAGVTDYLQKGSGTDHYVVLANRIKNVVSQYRAQQSIERTRHRFRTLVEEATDVILVIAPDGTISYATPSAERYLGRTPEELIGTNGFAPLHPDDHDHVMEEFAHIVEHPDQRRSAEFRYQRPDDTWVWLEARGRNLLTDPVVDGIVVYVRDITDRKERELELQQQERRYQAIFNDPNILVGLIDTDGTVIDINDTALEYIDATRDEIAGQQFWETPWFSHSQAIQADVRDWIDQAANGEYVEFEIDLVQPDGEAYAVEGVFRPVTDDDGNVVSLIISDREVTERKEHKRELERIRDFFTEAERLGNLGAWELVGTGNVVWTDGTRRIHEVDESFDPSLEDGLAFYHPDDREKVEEAVDCAIEDGDGFDIEARLITAKGNERWIRTRGEPMNDSEEQPTVRGYIQDITDQKRREVELQQAKSQLEAAVEAGNVATWEWHVPEDRLVTGPEFARKFGVDPTEAREGVPLDRFLPSIHEDDRDRIEQRIQEALDACGSYAEEYRVWNADDELRWVAARGDVQCDEGGKPVRFPGALTDITERKQAERELKRKNDRLDEFASIVSHDLQNPLTVAEGHLDLAQTEGEPEHLHTVNRAHGRMRSLINDLLTLAREGETLDEITTVELDGFIESCWEAVETADATLCIDIDRSIQADELRLRHLFENLLSNAIEHGSADCTITIGALDDGFYVEDTGQGIPEEAREDVFEAGFSTADDGTGFGLSIVKQVADAHGWEVRVTDGSDGGARFAITGLEFAD